MLELYLSHEITVSYHVPTPLEFHRYVAQNKPVIFRNSLQHWPAINKWTNDYLSHILADDLITVAISPHGYADAIVWNPERESFCFALPLEQKMKFHDFTPLLSSEEQQRKYGIPYIQLQNDNLHTEYSQLLVDVDEHISFATEALNRLPDAVNFWMGEEKSVTSLHKDYYENLYGVVDGIKEFTLYAPTDAYFLYYRDYPVMRYVREAIGRWNLEDMGTNVPWISVDPLTPNEKQFPLYRYATPMKAILYPGDMLYLPSLYFHHVQQHGKRVIAVNYWYDMEYDIKYVYYQYVQKTIQCIEKRLHYRL
jgi:jumonji domain-containing protein 7